MYFLGIFFWSQQYKTILRKWMLCFIMMLTYILSAWFLLLYSCI